MLPRRRPVRGAPEPDPPLGRDRVGRRPRRRPGRSSRPRRRPRQVTDGCKGEPIDLLHAGAARTVGVYLLDTSEGLSLFDCGPSSCIPALKDGSLERGVELGDLRNLLLSHIHLDHAGAAGSLAREWSRPPGLGLGSRRAAPDRPLAARTQRASALRRQLRRPLGRARASAGAERTRRRVPRRRPRGLRRARPRVAPRLLLRRQHALRRRRSGRADRAQPFRAAADATAGPRRRGLGTERSSRSSDVRPSGSR